MNDLKSEENGAVAVPMVVRHRNLSIGWQAILIVVTLVVVGLAINQLFNLGFFVGYTWLDNEYQYALVGLLVPLVFLIFPASDKASFAKVPWYDIILAAATFGLVLYFFINAEKIIDNGWEMGAPDYMVIPGFFLWMLVLEATRRAGGALRPAAVR